MLRVTSIATGKGSSEQSLCASAAEEPREHCLFLLIIIMIIMNATRLLLSACIQLRSYEALLQEARNHVAREGLGTDHHHRRVDQVVLDQLAHDDDEQHAKDLRTSINQSINETINDLSVRLIICELQSHLSSHDHEADGSCFGHRVGHLDSERHTDRQARQNEEAKESRDDAQCHHTATPTKWQRVSCNSQRSRHGWMAAEIRTSQDRGTAPRAY